MVNVSLFSFFWVFFSLYPSHTPTPGSGGRFLLGERRESWLFFFCRQELHVGHRKKGADGGGLGGEKEVYQGRETTTRQDTTRHGKHVGGCVGGCDTKKGGPSVGSHTWLSSLLYLPFFSTPPQFFFYFLQFKKKRNTPHG
jgi:hypothetical protein